ncbi:hypothetical protein [Gordonia phage GTE2]|uniref:Uncharacterized protein n=1 Tax=Gordonia phage GTE2 TaxID=981323 RepID=F8S0U5_9CAUD|nr:hypothetical protein GoPhGTE2_gp34 [Gordonia phage GTE2]ADX42620.1 hypothetical protein [Gordonia phage GTE2]
MSRSHREKIEDLYWACKAYAQDPSLPLPARAYSTVAIYDLIGRGFTTQKLIGLSGEVPGLSPRPSHTGVGAMCQVLEKLKWVNVNKTRKPYIYTPSRSRFDEAPSPFTVERLVIEVSRISLEVLLSD